MRVCIDLRFGLASGASTYMVNMVNALLRATHDHEIVLLEMEGARLELDRQVERITCPSLRAARQYVWVQRHLPQLLHSARIDIYHSLKHLGPFKADCRMIYSMSSLGGYVGYFSGIYPMPLSEHVYWRYFGRQWLKRLDALITCASFIGDHISSRFGFPAHRISCIPFGRDPYFRPADGSSDAPAAPIDEPYVLQVANVLPVKNTHTLVEAFEKVASRHPDLKLVICGNQSHSYFGKIIELVDRKQLGEQVVFKSGVSRLDLRDLYRRAELFTLPSFHEGSPLALMEAMSCGVPCVSSDRAGLPELGGDAVLRYQPAEDPGALAEVIERVLCDDELRSELARKSLERVKGYSWDRAARETLGVYERVV